MRKPYVYNYVSRSNTNKKVPFHYDYKTQVNMIEGEVLFNKIISNQYKKTKHTYTVEDTDPDEFNESLSVKFDDKEYLERNDGVEYNRYKNTILTKARESQDEDRFYAYKGTILSESEEGEDNDSFYAYKKTVLTHAEESQDDDSFYYCRKNILTEVSKN